MGGFGKGMMKGEAALEKDLMKGWEVLEKGLVRKDGRLSLS